jgi:hypothetical protein
MELYHVRYVKYIADQGLHSLVEKFSYEGQTGLQTNVLGHFLVCATFQTNYLLGKETVGFLSDGSKGPVSATAGRNCH